MTTIKDTIESEWDSIRILFRNGINDTIERLERWRDTELKKTDSTYLKNTIRQQYDKQLKPYYEARDEVYYANPFIAIGYAANKLCQQYGWSRHAVERQLNRMIKRLENEAYDKKIAEEQQALKKWATKPLEEREAIIERRIANKKRYAKKKELAFKLVLNLHLKFKALRRSLIKRVNKHSVAIKECWVGTSYQEEWPLILSLGGAKQ